MPMRQRVALFLRIAKPRFRRVVLRAAVALRSPKLRLIRKSWMLIRPIYPMAGQTKDQQTVQKTVQKAGLRGVPS